MAKHRASGDEPPSGEGATGSPGDAYWSVDDARWPAIHPDLPAHAVDLLAPPIVVGVARVPATSRLTPPPDLRPALAECRSAAPADLGPALAECRSAAPADLRPASAEHRVAPVGPRRTLPTGPPATTRRPVGAPAPGGRHRRQPGPADRGA